MNQMVEPSEATEVTEREERAAFSEAPRWKFAGDGWRQLHGSFRNLGYSVEWHDFVPKSDFDWSQSFHPQSVEICMNLIGEGQVQAGRDRLEFQPTTMGFYLQNKPRLTGIRAGGQRHQFITIELSKNFLAQYFSADAAGLYPKLECLLAGKPRAAAVSESSRLTSEHQQVMMSLRKPPVFAGAQRLWYHAKVLEIVSGIFYVPPNGQEFFCQRQKRLNHERVEKVIALLRENLTETLSLEEIGKQVGCSHFHLSRIFTQEIGKPIFQYLRDLRMERAAKLLREGKFNVTQVALEVGYNSSSHFSTAFHETFGCCPGLYPLATPTQRLVKHSV